MQRVVSRCLGACCLFMLFILGTPAAYAWNLLTPLPPNQVLSPAQTQRLDDIKQRPTTAFVSVRLVDLEALNGNRILVSLTGGATLEYTRTRLERRAPDDFTWFGAAFGVAGQTVLVVRGSNLTGTVGVNGTLYTVEPIGDGVHALIKLDQSRVHVDAPAVPTSVPPTFDTRGIQQATRMVQVDVLVVYTAARLREAGSQDNMASAIQLAIDETNETYRNSRIYIRLNLVDTFEVSYSEKGRPLGNVLEDFTRMQAVRNARYIKGADIAVMMIHDPFDACGMGYQDADASNAYAIVGDCNVAYLFAHELGHLQGACHEPDRGFCSERRPYAHPLGYGGWATIMSSSPLAERVPYWSNPRVTYDGIPIGTADTMNNARVLNETAEWVASFRDPRYEPCASEGGICAFNGQKEVAYGANLKFVYRTATNRIACTNGVFGDPSVGVEKACYVGPRSYTFCSIENQFCSFSGTRNVAYGAHDRFFYKTMTNGIDCNNGTFGDPVAGVAKACYIGPEMYSHCAAENQFCAFDGTKNVAYGANGQFVYKTATDGITCNNATFGDPIVGVGKACYLGPEPYSYCASEWTPEGKPGSCTFTGTKNVAYGANGHFVYKMATGGTECSKSAFGGIDPLYGTVKACYIGPEAYSYCASEWTSQGKPGFCAFRGTKTVAYGANGRFFYRTETNGVECSNGRFGDPIYGVAKACYTR